MCAHHTPAQSFIGVCTCMIAWVMTTAASTAFTCRAVQHNGHFVCRGV